MEDEKMSLVVFDPIKAELAKLQEKDKTLVFDHTTPDGEKSLRSWVGRLRGYKGDVARAHKDTKANALTFGRKVDTIKNELTAGADKLITERMKPLDEIEAKKRAEAEAIAKAEKEAQLKKEAEDKAELERREAEVAKKEAEIQEKERIEREKNIAAVASEKARKEAEVNAEREKVEAELEKKEAIERAEREKKEALKKAEREKQDAIEAEKKRATDEVEAKAKVERERIAAEKAEEARLAEVERKRVENEEHRSKIELEICKAFTAAFGVDFNSKDVVTVIKEGHIPNVTINY